MGMITLFILFSTIALISSKSALSYLGGFASVTLRSFKVYMQHIVSYGEDQRYYSKLFTVFVWLLIDGKSASI